MDNTEARAYACVALRFLQNGNQCVTEESLYDGMTVLMDEYSEKEIVEIKSSDRKVY